jgi:hypothetical protein
VFWNSLFLSGDGCSNVGWVYRSSERTRETMSALNLVLLNGHIYCRECLVQIPDTFLACPICYGLVRVRNQWVVPEDNLPPWEPEGQQILLFPSMHEYPA